MALPSWKFITEPSLLSATSCTRERLILQSEVRSHSARYSHRRARAQPCRQSDPNVGPDCLASQKAATCDHHRESPRDMEDDAGYLSRVLVSLDRCDDRADGASIFLPIALRPVASQYIESTYSGYQTGRISLLFEHCAHLKLTADTNKS